MNKKNYKIIQQSEDKILLSPNHDHQTLLSPNHDHHRPIPDLCLTDSFTLQRTNIRE